MVAVWVLKRGPSGYLPAKDAADRFISMIPSRAGMKGLVIMDLVSLCYLEGIIPIWSPFAPVGWTATERGG